jgi:hypothetical protein
VPNIDAIAGFQPRLWPQDYMRWARESRYAEGLRMSYLETEGAFLCFTVVAR